jgi:hypothetical protein
LSELRFYFDENVEIAVSEQLEMKGLDVVSAKSLGTLGDDDPSHLARATEMGRVLCTYDTDFLRLIDQGVEHSGVVFAQKQKGNIGAWVRGLLELHVTRSGEDMIGQVIFLPMK